MNDGRNFPVVMVLFAALVVSSPPSVVAASDGLGDAETSIRKVLADAELAWNQGDLAGYMKSYWRSEELCFVSGARIGRGWEPVLENYRRSYPELRDMGRLVFSDLEITLLAADAALVLGRWRLHRKADEPHGVFTLVVRELDEGWRIVHDHTSAAEPEPEEDADD